MKPFPNSIATAFFVTSRPFLLEASAASEFFTRGWNFRIFGFQQKTLLGNRVSIPIADCPISNMTIFKVFDQNLNLILTFVFHTSTSDFWFLTIFGLCGIQMENWVKYFLRSGREFVRKFDGQFHFLVCRKRF